MTIDSPGVSRETSSSSATLSTPSSSGNSSSESSTQRSVKRSTRQRSLARRSQSLNIEAKDSDNLARRELLHNLSGLLQKFKENMEDGEVSVSEYEAVRPGESRHSETSLQAESRQLNMFTYYWKLPRRIIIRRIPDRKRCRSHIFPTLTILKI